MPVAWALTVIAHAGEHASEGGEGALTAIVLASMIVPLVAVGVLGWVFWKAARRDRGHP